MSIKVTKCGLCGQSTVNPECHNCPNETMENKIHSYNLLNSKFEIAKKEINKHLQSISDWMRMTDERLEELSDHDERITDLEKIIDEKRLLDSHIHIEKRFKKIESEFPKIKEAFGFVKFKKPHKCPICDGVGFSYHAIIHKIDCKSCEGMGIVWG